MSIMKGRKERAAGGGSLICLKIGSEYLNKQQQIKLVIPPPPPLRVSPFRQMMFKKPRVM